MDNIKQEASDLGLPPMETSKPVATKAKPTATKRKGRKAVKKKPDDMPRRPLSAYNFFFSEMRTKLLADRAAGNDTAFQQFLAEREEPEGEKKNGFFSNMGKFVAKRWKELNQEELAPYTELAEKDLQRYRKEMDEYREGVARKTRLASEQKLREQEAEAAKMPQMATGNVGQAQPWMMAANPMMGFQNPADPSFQLLLRQQLLGMNAAQNPQFNAFLLQQQLGGGAQGMPMGFPGQFGGFGQQQPLQQQQQQSQNQDLSQQQQPQPQQQQFPDMQQNQDLLNSLQQQQNRAQGMFPGMMHPAQFGGMPMGMVPSMGMNGQDGGGGAPGNGVGDQMQQQLSQGQQGGQMQPNQGGGAGSQWI